MKRAPFMGAAAAAFMTGCGGHHVLQALPGVAPSKSSRTQVLGGGFVPSTADKIPDNVLTRPIIGEAWRFDGTVAPAGWLLAQGQSITVSDYRMLFSILGTSAGGDGKVSFRLPKPGVGYIVAVAGMYPSSPTLIAQSGRRMSAHADSLRLPAALRRAPQLVPERARALADARKLSASAVRYAAGFARPMAADVLARMESTRVSTRDVALGALSEPNRSTFAAAADALAGGALSLNDGIARMSARLSASEANALLDANDARIRTLRGAWSGMARENPQFEAARFLFSIGLTHEQVNGFVAHQPQI